MLNLVCEGPPNFSSLSFTTPTPSYFLSVALAFSVIINNFSFLTKSVVCAFGVIFLVM